MQAGTAELVHCLLPKFKVQAFKLGNNKTQRAALFLLGIVLLAVTLLYPKYSPAFIWMSIYLIVDPINYRFGARNLISETKSGNWSSVIVLWIASLICGFFWELWNFYSNPKWFYSVPGVDFWYIFEMPALGYLGYLPFILESFAIFNLVVFILRGKRDTDYLQLGAFS